MSSGTRDQPADYQTWGDNLDEAAIEQMRNAMRLEVSVAGALMADAHVGYGLPIGGVLATDNAVIPFAVGVDIACRMRLSVLDIDVRQLERDSDRLATKRPALTRTSTASWPRRPIWSKSSRSSTRAS
jgi:tRNA-splicing ligase RtcB (3'-phosphate/5'-hydroxy nucleic acid ligase)